MGEVMFKDDSFIKNSYQTLTSEREFLLKELSSFKDLTVYPSKGNFILSEIKSKKIKASEIREILISKQIIIRDCKSFEGLDEYFFRVCTLNHNQNSLLIKTLESIFINK